MERFLAYIAGLLAEYPEEVVVTPVASEGRTIYRLQMRKTDVPRLMGKQGQTLAALRSVAAAAGRRTGVRVELEVAGEG
jgi:predicted RNA-binding protein YlqC (UPF0109 family)